MKEEFEPVHAATVKMAAEQATGHSGLRVQEVTQYKFPIWWAESDPPPRYGGSIAVMVVAMKEEVEKDDD